MNILSARIDWNDEYDNPANLVIRVDSIPPSEDLCYEKKGSYYFAEQNGYVSFFFDDPKNHEGYGGSRFDLTMKDGSKVTLVGPWSGNPMGAASVGFPKSYDVHAICPSKYGDSHYGIHLTEPVWLDTIKKFCPDAEVVQVGVCAGSDSMSSEQNLVIGCLGKGKPKGVSYEIVRKGMTVAQTYAYKRAIRFSRYIKEIRDENPFYGENGVDKQRKLAIYVNEMIEENDLQKFGLQLFDMNNLPPLLPPRPPEPVCYTDPEDF